ncbi:MULTISPECIES: adenylate/guanylate cyclase domain-containing protein [Bradyrhizobium]|jgi:adenylate cyclase|uniref:Adenylate cyclase, class 3 n=2 Tax=Bradyrhizobium TaxID=374 RepID=A0ABY0QCV4_9BRAD|nr:MULTISPECIES: adenylate/guanylate cyclase domain-containing protein [Bradyrhizobium]SDJ93310.1 Adenylate cyclase, class 3 [Bradyrhizobium ottawaense]SEB97560.1 Adenylate cyclase, class 3 [Bradyrhizobium lablabi]SHM66135.1 Adenylate cyclase, class 3 [Bradyrhizobium lablabi]
MAIELVTARTAPTAIEPVAAQRRRLMAVMLADVVGYSRMMSRSEDETHARFAGHARELIDPTVDKYNGHLVRSMGDGLLVEFSSAVDAVRCALDIQRGLAARQVNEKEKDRIRLRIGINTGDVLVDQRDLYGNSVNIAARLEALASPGTVCVSQSIYDQTRALPQFFFADRGERRVKNIPYPVHVYEVAYERIRVSFLHWIAARWSGMAITASIGAIAVASIASVLMFRELHGTVARTNRIVVLPFKNFDGNRGDGYLADAITDDLTNELSRLQRAWVISSGTAFTYKDKQNDPRQIGRELRVRYALEGSVRRTGPLVQVNAQLIDTESGTNLWANSFAYETGSLLDLQDKLMSRIAASLNDEVIRTGVRHEVGTLAADHNPLDERMRAMAANTGFQTAEKSLEARRHAEAGLMADPDNARLLGLIATKLTSDVLNGWNDAGNAEVERADAAARKAIGLDPNVQSAHFALGWVHRLRGNHQAALDAFRQAIKINPNFASAYAQAGNEMVFLGDPKGAIALAEKACELSPKDMSYTVFLWVKGRAYFAIGDYEKAAEALGASVRARPNLWFTHAWLIAALALTNRNAEAKQAIDEFKEAHNSRSDLASITKYYSEDQYQNPTAQKAVAQLLSGLRKAGVN